jgi:glycosyltransferase involved in cell wall biosynthesis
MGTGMPSPECSVGLVHDYLLVMRGAERSFAAIAASWPEAPIYTLLYDERETNFAFHDRIIRTSYLQRLGVRQAGFRRLLPLFPAAAERLPVAGHDVVISSSSAFAHGVRPRKDAVHVCYCYTPFRYAWHESERALSEMPRLLRPAVRRILKRIRSWDAEASKRVTRYVAISELARERIRRSYGQDSSIIHPPVEVHRFAPGTPEDFFLVVTELVSHKRVELALAAAEEVGQPIKVVGAGPELPRLRQRYGATAEFLGRVSDTQLSGLYARARALIVPNVEEFGIAAVEAQAAGRPVVAAGAGGALETVIDGETGVLVRSGDVKELVRALRETRFDDFDPETLVRHAHGFSVESFKRRFRAEVEAAVRAA